MRFALMIFFYGQASRDRFVTGGRRESEPASWVDLTKGYFFLLFVVFFSFFSVRIVVGDVDAGAAH